MKSYLKIPVEMAQFALKERKVSNVQAYLAAQFMYPGKCRTSDNPQKEISSLLSASERNIYRAFDWLLSRNWMGKDSINGWYFFRGLNRIHEIENWKYTRAVIIQIPDLQNIKPFFISAVISSAIKTGRKREGGTDQQPRRSTPIRFPVPVSFIEKVLSVSRRTAITYMKIARKSDYLKMYPNQPQVVNLTPKDVHRLRKEDIEQVKVQFIGNNNSEVVWTSQLRTNKGSVLCQKPNFYLSHLLLGKRRIKKKNQSHNSVAIKGASFENEGDKLLSQLHCNSS